MTRELIEDIREIVLPFVRSVLLKTNYERLGKSDAEEFTRDFNEILDLATKALEQEPRWIPVSERLPEEDTDVLVTLKCGLIGIMQKKLADDDNGEPCYIWQDFEGEEHEVIAWMPLPQAYREVEE